LSQKKLAANTRKVEQIMFLTKMQREPTFANSLRAQTSYVSEKRTHICLLQGNSLKPTILYSVFVGLVFIRRFLSILFAC